jgi:hypothetical protein
MDVHVLGSLEAIVAGRSVPLGGAKPRALLPESLIRHACGVAGRRLTRTEWTEFLPGRGYDPACTG